MFHPSAHRKATPELNAHGDPKYRNPFPYFFSSTAGTLPSIPFSHHANWQKLVPFTLFIYLAETACSIDETASQSCVEVPACLAHFSVEATEMWKKETQDWTKLERVFWLDDAYLWSRWCDGMWRVEENSTWAQIKMVIICPAGWKLSLWWESEQNHKTSNLNDYSKPHKSAIPHCFWVGDALTYECVNNSCVSFNSYIQNTYIFILGKEDKLQPNCQRLWKMFV